MADYSARIELLISGLDRLKALEQRVSKLQQEAEKLSKPIPKAGTAALADVIEEAATAQKGLNGQTERGLMRQIKLNSAVRLYERRLAEVGRTAASSQKQFAGDLKQIQDAFEVFKGKGSVKGVQAVATELGRIVEYSREVTRLEVGRVKTSEQIKSFADQINKLKAAGLDVSKAEKTLEKFSVNAGTNKFKLAERYRIVLNGRLKALREELTLEQQIAREQRQKSASRRQRVVGTASNALIGAGFPLLFGQGGAAALGGGLGGLAGGLIGGPAGFALSIVGTAIGQAVGEAEKFNTELAVLNARAKKLGAESITTARDVNQLAKALGVTKDEALKVLAAYSGFDNAKVRNALAVLYGDDSSTFAALAAAKDQASLAQVIFNTYNKIGVERADQLLDQLKSGDLAAVELAFQQALLEVEMEKTKERLRQVTLQDQIVAGFANIAAVQGGGDFVDPKVFGEERVKQFEAQNNPADILERTQKALKALQGLQAKTAGFQPTKRTPGQSALESSERRTAAIKANSQALFMAAMIQDRITAAERIGAKEQALALTRRRDQVKLIGEYDAKIAKVKETENSAEEIAALRQERNVKLVAQQLDYENKLLALRMQQQAAGYEITSQLQNDTYLIEEILAGRGKEAAIQQEIRDKVLAANDPARSQEIADQVRRKAALTEQLEEARKLEAVYADIASTLSQGMTQALKDVVKGTQSLRDAAMSMLNNVLNKIIDIAMNMAMFGVASGTGTGGGLLGGLFGLGKTVPGRAYGGPVNGKMPYIVGENGPELYVPGRSGTIVPNHKLPKMVDLGGKFMPFHPLFMSAMFGLGNFGNNRQAVMESFGARFGQYAGGTMPFGALQGRAAGGPVTGGTPYIVGEQGPEMFVPRSGGGMGGNVSNNIVVNVSASGGNVEGDQQGAKQLGQAVAAAVQQELIRQKRPGGLLA